MEGSAFCFASLRLPPARRTSPQIAALQIWAGPTRPLGDVDEAGMPVAVQVDPRSSFRRHEVLYSALMVVIVPGKGSRLRTSLEELPQNLLSSVSLKRVRKIPLKSELKEKRAAEIAAHWPRNSLKSSPLKQSLNS